MPQTCGVEKRPDDGVVGISDAESVIAKFATLLLLECFQFGGFILRDGASRLPQDEVLDPHGEERGNAARLEPGGNRAGPVAMSASVHTGSLLSRGRPCAGCSSGRPHRLLPRD